MDDLPVIPRWPNWGRCPEEHGKRVINATVYRGMLVHFWPFGATPESVSFVCVTPYGDQAGVPSMLDERWWPADCPKHAVLNPNEQVTRCLELWLLNPRNWPFYLNNGRYLLPVGQTWTDWIDTNLWGEYDAYTGSTHPVPTGLPEIGVDVHGLSGAIPRGRTPPLRS